MSLVLIHAQAPWGPVSFRTADSMADALARGQAPAAMVDVEGRDPAEMVRLAYRLLPPPMDATGQIPVTVEKARQIVAEAVSGTPAAIPVAGKVEIAAHGAPASVAEASEREGLVGSAPSATNHPIRAVCETPVGTVANGNIPRRAVSAGMMTNDDISVEHRPGAGVDAKAIRTRLGLSQPAFAKTFGITLATLRDWEQGRSKPEGMARVLLAVIAHRPDAVQEAVAGAGEP